MGSEGTEEVKYEREQKLNPVNIEEIKRQAAAHRAKKAQLMEAEQKKHFSYALRATQTEEEKSANEKL